MLPPNTANSDGTSSNLTPVYEAHATGGKRPPTADPTNRVVHPPPSGQAPGANTGGNPSITTPSSDQNTNSRRPPSSSTPVTASTRLDPQVAYRSNQMPATNTGGNPSITTPPSDPNTNSRRTQGSTATTTTSTGNTQVVQRSGQVPAATAGGTPSIAPPQHDGNPSSKGHNSSSMGTTNRVQSHHPAQDAHHLSEDQEKGYSGSKKPSRNTDLGGQRTPGVEGGRRNVSRRPTRSSKEASARGTGTTDRKESQSGSSIDSMDITMGGRGSHSYSATDQERQNASKTTASPANIQPQPNLGSQHTLHAQAHIKEKPQFTNHPETGSNASDTRGSDSINSRQTQFGSKPTQRPPGAAEAQPPTAKTHPETQPGEDASTDDHSTQPSSYVVIDLIVLIWFQSNTLLIIKVVNIF
jgi:hypothetical protein